MCIRPSCSCRCRGMPVCLILIWMTVSGIHAADIRGSDGWRVSVCRPVRSVWSVWQTPVRQPALHFLPCSFPSRSPRVPAGFLPSFLLFFRADDRGCQSGFYGMLRPPNPLVCFPHDRFRRFQAAWSDFDYFYMAFLLLLTAASRSVPYPFPSSPLFSAWLPSSVPPLFHGSWY